MSCNAFDLFCVLFLQQVYSGLVLKRLVKLQSCEKAKGWCTVRCEMLQFYVKTIVKGSHDLELACLK